MDSAEFISVAKGTLITSLTTGLGVGAYEVLQGRRAGPLAAASALNGGLVAATFFSVREYAISPLLAANLTRPQHDKIAGNELLKSWTDMRKHNLLDSAVSGALTGGMFNTWQRGRVGTLPGLCTGALVCAILQWGSNELEIARVRYVSQNPYKPPAVLPITAEKKGLTERVFTAVGFKKITDEEHLVKLRATRDSTLIQIEKLEAEEKKSVGEEGRH